MFIFKNLIVDSCPIVKDKDHLKGGYDYHEREEWDVDGKLAYDDYDWKIYPDGTFSHYYDSDCVQFLGYVDGTFDSSKYEDFVNQMKNHETDWKDELFYDKSTYGGDMG